MINSVDSFATRISREIILFIWKAISKRER